MPKEQKEIKTVGMPIYKVDDKPKNGRGICYWHYYTQTKFIQHSSLSVIFIRRQKLLGIISVAFDLIEQRLIIYSVFLIRE